jgi:hypothetical protein
VKDDRACDILLQFLVDVPDERFAFLLIGLGGLPVEQLQQLGIAVAV